MFCIAGTAATKVDCGLPKAPLNGIVTLLDANNTTLHAIAEYKCDPDHYLIFGEDRAVCQGDGTWSGEERVCIYSKALEPCKLWEIYIVGNLMLPCPCTVLSGRILRLAGYHNTCYTVLGES